MKKIKYGCEVSDHWPLDSATITTNFWFDSIANRKKYVSDVVRAHMEVASGSEIGICEIISVDGEVYRHVDSPIEHFKWRPTIVREQGEGWYTQYPAIVDVINGRVIVVEQPAPDDLRTPAFTTDCNYCLEEEGRTSYSILDSFWPKLTLATPDLQCHLVVDPYYLDQLKLTHPVKYPKFPVKYRIPKFKG
jgi:hypothetical protein